MKHLGNNSSLQQKFVLNIFEKILFGTLIMSQDKKFH